MTYEGKLRRVGGSIMLAVPPAVLAAMGAHADDAVEMEVTSGRLTVAPKRRKHYTLDELIAQAAKPGRRDKAWVAGKPRGRELI